MVNGEKNTLLNFHSPSSIVAEYLLILNGLLLTLAIFLHPDPNITFYPLVLRIIAPLLYLTTTLYFYLKGKVKIKLIFHIVMILSLIMLFLIHPDPLYLTLIFFLLFIGHSFSEQDKVLFYSLPAFLLFILKLNIPYRDLFFISFLFLSTFSLLFFFLKKLRETEELLFFHEKSFLSFLENFKIPNIINYCIFQTSQQNLFWGEKNRNIKVLNTEESKTLDKLLNHFSSDQQKSFRLKLASKKKNASKWTLLCEFKNDKNRSFTVKCHGFHFNLKKDVSIETLVFQDISTFKEDSKYFEHTPYSQFLEQLSVPFFLKNNTGQYEFVNGEFSKIFNISNKKIVGKRDSEIFTKTISQNLNKLDSEIFNYGRTIFYKDDFFSSHNELKKFLTIKIPLNNPSKNTIDGLLGILLDISDELSERENLKEDIVILNEATKLASLAEMSSGIAHEINNPLTIIAGIVQIMEMKLENNRVTHKELLEFAKQIHRGTERASNVVRGLEEFSRDGSQDPMQSQSLKIICNESLSIFNEKCSKFKIKIIKDNLHPLYIHCRSIQIIQIIFHLLNNSIFEILKLDEKWIEFSTKEDSEFIYLRITDSGRGIPTSISKKIFDPFFSKKEGKNKSTGLGLSIAKVILHEHKGDIEYDLDNGHTSFILKFPKIESQTQR